MRSVPEAVPPDVMNPYTLIFDMRADLADRIAAFDDTGAHTVLDRLLAGYTVSTVITEILVPYLIDLGDRWAAGTASIAEEHFASSLIRGRLLGLAGAWGGGVGSRALLACPSGERHDLGLICFGLALRGHGWRITFLGADTPRASLAGATLKLRPDLVVLASTTSDRLSAGAAALTGIGVGTVAIAGRGATETLAAATGAMLLDDEPVAAARAVRLRFAQAVPARVTPAV